MKDKSKKRELLDKLYADQHSLHDRHKDHDKKVYGSDPSEPEVDRAIRNECVQAMQRISDYIDLVIELEHGKPSHE